MSEGSSAVGDDVFQFRYGDKVSHITGFYAGYSGVVVGAIVEGEGNVEYTVRYEVVENGRAVHQVDVNAGPWEIAGSGSGPVE